MKLITVTGYKGGCGKSTTAIHLATYFSDRGKTLLIDSDPNRTAIEWSSRGSLPFTVEDERKAIKLIPGSDYVIVDTPARPKKRRSARISRRLRFIDLADYSRCGKLTADVSYCGGFAK